MSVSRSVAAAQRRRAGPPETSTPPYRGPGTSINSAMLQQQQPNPAFQSQQSQRINNPGLDTKMTVPQAITLITLRLGRIESQLMNGQFPTMMSEGGNEDYAMVDRNLLQSLVARVDSLEKRSATAAAASQSSSAPAASSMEITALKQQVEVLRQAVVATKNGIATSNKESKDSKTILENLRFEVDELKIIVADVQNLALDNNQKLAAISLQLPGDGEDNLLLEETEGNDDGAIDNNNIIVDEGTVLNNMSVVVEDVDVVE